MSQDLIVTTQKNLMKRHPASGHDIMSAPDISFFSGSGYYSEYHIPHTVTNASGVPIAPLFRAYYEPWGDGQMIMVLNDSDWEIDNPPNGISTGSLGPACMAYVTTSELVFVLFADHSMAGQTIPIYWVIYEDYSLD